MGAYTEAEILESIKDLKPYGPYSLVIQLDREETTPGGIIIPDTAIEKSMMHKVISVGAGVWIGNRFVKPPVKPGDIVCVRQFDGKQVHVQKFVKMVHLDLLEAIFSTDPWPVAA